MIIYKLNPNMFSKNLIFSCLLFLLLCSIVACASGLYISPDQTKYSGKKVIIYHEDDPTSDISLQLPVILASEVPFNVISYSQACSQVGKENWDSDDLAKIDVGLVIMVKDISFHRDMIRKQPMVQITIGNNPPSWDWEFLSAASANFKVYEVQTGNLLVEGHFPPKTFSEYSQFAYGSSSCPKSPSTSFDSWAMSPAATPWSMAYIQQYVGNHTECSPYEPTGTETYYQLADRKAMKKLVSYIAKKVPAGDKPSVLEGVKKFIQIGE
jgi:hypothetical protein